MEKCHEVSQKWRLGKRTLVAGLWQSCSKVSGSFKMACTWTANIGDVNGEEWQWQTGLGLHREDPVSEAEMTTGRGGSGGG